MPKTPVQQMLQALVDALQVLNDDVEAHGAESFYGKYTEQDLQQLNQEMDRFDASLLLHELHNMLPQDS